MRITLAQAKKLNIDLGDGKRKAAKPKGKTPDSGTSDPKASATGAKPKGKNRERRADHGRKALKFSIDLPADPQPKERPRTVINMASVIDAFVKAHGNLGRFKELVKGKTSHTYTPKNTADYEELIKVHAMVAMREAKLEPFRCPVKTHVHLTFAGDERLWPTSPGDGDADNLEKAVLDALNGIVYADDRLVVKSYRSKTCGAKPRLVVKVSPANG